MKSQLRLSPERIHYLDFARFFAAIIVASFHFNLQDPQMGDGFMQVGYLAVHFFFLVSGFVIARSAETTPTVEFLIRRFIRVAPTYWAASFFLGIIKLRMGSHVEQPITLWDFFGNVSMLSLTPLGKILNCNHFIVVTLWTIGYELYFYVLIALAGLFKNGRNVFMYSWIAISAFESFRIGIVSRPEYLLRVATMFEAAPLFAGGYFLWGWYESRKLRPQQALVLLGCFVLSLKNCYELAPEMFDWTAPTAAIPGLNEFGGPLPIDLLVMTLIWAFFLVVILTKSAHRKTRPGLLKLELLLGSVTYPMYLIHPALGPFITRLTGVFHSKILAIGVMDVVAVAVSYGIIRIFEKPIQDWMKKRLLKKRVPAQPIALLEAS